MTGEIVTVDQSPIAVQTDHSILAVIARAAADPTVDVDKMQRLLDMQLRLMERQAEAAYNSAMKAAQDEMLPIARDAENEHTRSKYARLETIDAAIRPIYTRHGFSLSFNSAQPSGKGSMRMICTVRHDAGHSATHELEGDLDIAGAKGAANKTNIQGLGSTASYLRRYLTMMIFNIVLRNEDNDGNSTKTITEKQADSIEDMIREIGMDDAARATFLWICNSKSVGQMHPAVYPTAINLLNAKRRGATK